MVSGFAARHAFQIALKGLQQTPSRFSILLMRIMVCRCAGPEAEVCKKLIEAHKVCLRKEGFKV